MATTRSRADYNGPFLVGSMLSSWLGGVACTLAIAYFVRFPYGKDRKLLFWMVVALVMCNIGEIVTGFGSVWELAIEMPEGQLVWTDLPKGWGVTVVLNGWTTFLVQEFYAYRVWVASGRKRVLPALISIMALVALGFSQMTGLMCLTYRGSFKEMISHYPYMAIVWLSSAAAADLVITPATYWYIRKASDGLPKSQKSRHLARLVRTTAETNVVTFSVVMLDLLLYAILESPWHLAVNMPMPVFYMISFLIAILSRSWMGDSNPTQSTRVLATYTSARPQQTHPVALPPPGRAPDEDRSLLGLGGRWLAKVRRSRSTSRGRTLTEKGTTSSILVTTDELVCVEGDLEAQVGGAQRAGPTNC